MSYLISERRVRPMLPPVLGCLLAATLSSGCSSKSTADATARRGGTNAPVPVLATQAIEKPMPVRIQAIGNVMPYSKVTIRSQITAELKEVHFKEGQEIRKGDLLFTLDPRPTQAALDQARANLARDEAQLENARIQYEREKKLFESQLVSREEFDNAHASLDAQQGIVLADRAAINNASLNLEFTTIRSPLDGVTGAQLVFAGNIIKAEDDQMVMINQVHPILASFGVAEQFLPEIQQRQREGALQVSASYAGMKGAVPAGKLTFVDNTVDTTTGTIQLKATFANEDNVLWPGQFVTVAMTLRENPRAIVVPSQAVQLGQNGEFIYVVRPDKSVEARPVKTDFSADNETVVADGLKAGETVVTDGQLRLEPGTHVDIKPPTALGPGPTNTPPSTP